jgi:hypothetical protein
MAATISRQFLTAEDLVRAPVSPCRFMANVAALGQAILGLLTLFPVSVILPVSLGYRVVKGMGLRPLICWDCGFESRRWHGCLSRVSVVCLSGRGHCVGIIICPEESYRV